jgi:GNAT superfamily N-acetyltransferase
MSDSEIRPAEEGDAERVALLSFELGYPAPPNVMRDRLAAARRDPAQAVLVAGRPAMAFLHLRVVESLTSPRETEIEALVVDESARGRGLGRALVAAAIAVARERGCARVRVRSQLFRERAHAFYARLGFFQLKTQHVFIRALF